MSNTVLFALWGALYALCAGLGFVAAPGATLRLLMIFLSVAMFVPPFLLNKRGNRRVRLLVRNLSLAWLIVTGILLPAGTEMVSSGTFTTIGLASRPGVAVKAQLNVIFAAG